MESVYFGKEASPGIYTDGEGSEESKAVREYYFPDEGHRKYKMIAFFSALFLTAIMDVIVLMGIIPLAIALLGDRYPLFGFIDVGIYLMMFADLMAIYLLLSLILCILIRNTGRKKVYVRDNDKFYFVKQKVRVKTTKAYIFESDTHLNKRVNARYSKIIAKTDKMIAKGSGRVRKVLTGCRASDSIHEKGTFYTGYNEKRSCDEEFTIPDSYAKYDAASAHRTSNGFISVIFIVKIVLYMCVFAKLFNIGSARYNVYLNDIDSYVAKKDAVLSPMGFYQDTYGNEYDHLDYFVADDSFRSSRIRYGFTCSDAVKLEDEFIFMDMSLYKDDDIEFIKKIINETYEDETLDLSVIDRTIQAYLDSGEEETKETVKTEKTYFTITIASTDFLGYDYTISIYIVNREKTAPHWSWLESALLSA